MGLSMPLTAALLLAFGSFEAGSGVSVAEVATFRAVAIVEAAALRALEERTGDLGRAAATRAIGDFVLLVHFGLHPIVKPQARQVTWNQSGRLNFVSGPSL